MKQIQNLLCKFAVLVTLLIIIPVLLFAQGGPGDPGCSPDNHDANGNWCPIDSNVWILLAFGVLYGLVAIYKFRTCKKEEPVK